MRYHNTPTRENEQAALQLAEHGIPVFPFRAVPRPGKDPIKKPCLKGWQEKATTDPDQIARWWRKWPDAMPGIPTGKRTGFAVLDVDRKNGKDGFETLKSLGIAPEELSAQTVSTPSGGRHIYFACPEGIGGGAADQFGPGLDLRAEGNYVAAPGAVNGKGVYELLSGSLTDELPSWPEALPIAKRRSDPGEAQPTGLPFPAFLEALAHLPNDGDEFASRDDWLRIGMALHAETSGDEDGREAWHDWSAQWPGYDPTATDEAWDSFKADRSGGVTGETIIAEAEKRGWRKTYLLDEEEDVRASAEELLDDEAFALIWPTRAPKTHLTFTTPGEAAELPPKPYVIKGLLAEGDIGAIVGAPGAGKSLIAPYLGYAVARGAEVFGRRTRKGGVFYVAAEDPRGMLTRVATLRDHHGEADAFQVVSGVSDLLSKESKDRKALVAEVKARRPSLIVIDTVSIAFPGLEENDAKAMSSVVAVARALTKWGAAVLLIHHDTKEGGGLPRGHSVLNGALDVSIHLKRDGRIVTGRPTKNRNGTTEQTLAFEVVEIERGIDADGDPITTAICEEVDAGTMQPRCNSLPASAKAALEILEGLMRGKTTVAKSDWRAACLASDAVSAAEEVNDRRKAFRRALEQLARRGLYVSEGDEIRFTASPEMLLGDDDV